MGISLPPSFCPRVVSPLALSGFLREGENKGEINKTINIPINPSLAPLLPSQFYVILGFVIQIYQLPPTSGDFHAST